MKYPELDKLVDEMKKLADEIRDYYVKRGLCPLCSKPSPDGIEHPECIERQKAWEELICE